MVLIPWRERLVVAVAALATVGATARLGVWQLDRARQKQAIGEAIATRSTLPPLPAAALARDAEAAASQHYRRIVLQGRWLAPHTVFLDNRQMDGRPGFYVVTPLELAPGDAVLVQRGWLPRHRQDRTQLPPLETPGGQVTVVARIAPPPSALLALGEGSGGAIRQNLGLDDFAREIGVTLRPLSLQQLDEDAPAPQQLLQRRWPQPVVDVSKHHGYAFQWFALSALVAGLYVWFQLIRPRRLPR